MSGNRFAEFDILKGIGIILVLFGHTAIPMEAKNVIYMFHMPLFFFCSGLFFKIKCIPQQIANDAKRLLIPWLTFFAIYQLAYFTILQVPTPNTARYIEYVTANCSLLNERSMWYPTIWFLPCLFLIRTIYNLIYKLCKGNIVATTAITSGGYLIGNQLVTPLFIDTAISSLIFYHLGHVLFNSHRLRQPYNPLIAIATLTLLSIITLRLNVHVEMKDNIFPLYMILLALPMIWNCYQLSLSLAKSATISHLLATCGKSSLTIFSLHQALWLFLLPATNKLSIPPNILSIILVILSLPLLVICDKLIKRHLHYLYGL